MSFLERFDADFGEKLERRTEGFRIIFQLLEQMQTERYLILETGMLRQVDNWIGDGQSTKLFDAFVNFHDGAVFSVDIDPNAISITRPIVSFRTHCICSDSVKFLNDFGRMIDRQSGFDLIYLDSFDLDLGNPDPSTFHHIKELLAIGSLKHGSLFVVDDNFNIDSKPVGKGRMVDEYFSNIGVKRVYDGYQKIWQIR